MLPARRRVLRIGSRKARPELANAVRTVAGRVEGISDDVRDRSLNELIASVTEFAGQKPVAFFGCGILAGLVISRLLSTSNR